MVAHPHFPTSEKREGHHCSTSVVSSARSSLALPIVASRNRDAFAGAVAPPLSEAAGEHQRHPTLLLLLDRERERERGGRSAAAASQHDDEAVQVQEDLRLLRQQPGQEAQLPRRRHRARQRAGGAQHRPGVRRRRHRAHGARLPGRLRRGTPRHRGDSEDAHDPRDKRRDGGGGAAGGGHAPAEGGDGAAVGRLHRAAWRVRHAGGAAGGDHVGAAGHPPQARGPAQRRRLLQRAAHLHRQGGGGGLHQPQRAPHHRARANSAGAHGQARGVRAIPRQGGVHAQLGDS